jgi:hypothetical protein
MTIIAQSRTIVGHWLVFGIEYIQKTEEICEWNSNEKTVVIPE